MSQKHLWVWHKDCDDSRTDVDDKQRPGSPSTSITDDSVCRTDVRSRYDRSIKLTDMARELDISLSIERRGVHDHVDHRLVSVRWVPKNLTDNDKACRVELSVMHLTRHANQRENFLQ